jgi:hypothetical protein
MEQWRFKQGSQSPFKNVSVYNPVWILITLFAFTSRRIAVEKPIVDCSFEASYYRVPKLFQSVSNLHNIVDK